jgi:hypothetical protein
VDGGIDIDAYIYSDNKRLSIFQCPSLSSSTKLSIVYSHTTNNRH